MDSPQHLALSVSPKGKVHFVRIMLSVRAAFALCGNVPNPRGRRYSFWMERNEKYFNAFHLPITCKRCKREMEKRGWECK